MPTDPINPRRDYRALALLGAVSRRGRTAEGLLRLHPGGQRLLDCSRQRRHFPDLAELLWDELCQMEVAAMGRVASVSPTAGRTPAQYWQRRRRLTQRALWLSLPPLWAKLLQLPASELKELCVVLGVEVIARAVWGQPQPALIKLLAPLGTEIPRRVVDRFRRLTDPIDGDLAARWLQCFIQAASRGRGKRIAESLGYAVLCVVFRQDSVSDAAAGIGRSNLCDVLRHTEPLAVRGKEEMELLAKMVQSCLGDGG